MVGGRACVRLHVDVNDERQHAHRHQQDVPNQDRVDDRRDENQNQTSEIKIHPIKLNSHYITILLKLCSDQAKANAKTNIFFDFAIYLQTQR